jgi:integrase
MMTGRRRKKFKATSLEEAVEKAAHCFFGHTGANPVSHITISDCFLEWRKRLSCGEATIKTDYWPRVRQFVRWADSHGLTFWSELRLQHLQQYANDAAESGNSRSTINLKTRVVSMTARWAALNWPEQCQDFTQGFRAPKGREGNRRLRRDSLSLEDAAMFLLFLRDRPYGWNILPGVALCALCSIRLSEVRKLRWADVDLEPGLVRITGRDVKTVHSDRTIPIPGLIRDILDEAKRRQRPRSTDAVLVTNKRASYWKTFTRYRNKWRPGLNVEPNGLRRVLRSEWFKRRWHADSLAVYRGHKPPNASAVDWNHYIIFDPESLQKMFREEVVTKIDWVLAPYRDRWNRERSNVVDLNPDSKRARSPVQKGPEKGPLVQSEKTQFAEAIINSGVSRG